MAAVTVAQTVFNVIGKLRQNFYDVAGNNGDTLTVGLTTVHKVNVDPGTITSWTIAAGSVVGTTVITFVTGGGAFTDTDVEVLGN
jgi:hypothetical protein